MEEKEEKHTKKSIKNYSPVEMKKEKCLSVCTGL
jgi:hypothetical protein